MTPEINNIYIKVVHNKILTPEEERLLAEKFKKDPGLKSFLLHLRDIRNDAILLNEKDLDEKQALTAIRRRMLTSPKRVVPLGSWIKYAAVFTGIAVTVYGIYTSRGFRDETDMATPKVTLQLGDGSIRELDEEQARIITRADGRQVVSQDKNELRYDRNPDKDPGTATYNQLIVPHAKTFQLILSDGTHVYVNSGTKIKYPESFLGQKNRIVQIEDGEAYFSVSRDTTHPFIVQTGEMEIEVLGTVFNISAYREDKDIRTVLVEGSVQVTPPGKPEGRTLSPREMASYDKEGQELTVAPVEVASHIAWKDGRMLFIDEPFESIVKKIERSYGVKVINYNKELLGAHFYGDFDMTRESVEDVLKVFSTGKPFDYEIRNDTIIIEKILK